MGSEGPVEGRVRLRVEWDGMRVLGARVVSRRPQPQSLLQGRDLPAAAVILPRLYSVCGEAQGVAAQALASAGELDAARVRTWQERLRLETVREHLWRLGLDWTQATGQEPWSEWVRTLLHERERFLRDADASAQWARQVQRQLYRGAGLETSDAFDPDALQAWIRASGTPLSGLLQALSSRLVGLGRGRFNPMPTGASSDLLRELSGRLREDPDYHWRPDWSGQVFEMGPAARAEGGRQGVGPGATDVIDAWTRVTARVEELHRLLGELARGQPATGHLAVRVDGDAVLVAVEMARGTLVHWARLDAGKIAAYRIVAPTEWNFHPRGACQQGLEGMEATGEGVLRTRVQHHVMALDPCVRYQLEVSGA